MSIKAESKLSRTIRCLAAVEKIWILSNLSNDESLSFELFQYYSRNNDLSTLKLTEEDTERLYGEIDEDEDKTISKGEMVIFFEVLLAYEQNPNYEKLLENLRSKVLNLHSEKALDRLKYEISSKMLLTPAVKKNPLKTKAISNFFLR